MDNLLHKIAITKIPDIGSKTAKNLIGHCGGVKAVFEAKRKDLLKIAGIGPQTFANFMLHKKKALLLAEQEILFLEKHKITPLFYLNPDYPLRLKSLESAPVMLYYRGKAALNHARVVGIVGTRKPTMQGRSICEELVDGLKPYGAMIVSGLAYGVDVTAHRRCLTAGVPTVGVLGHGFKQIYPPEHRSVAEKMILNGGLLTEYSSELSVEKGHFPARNRIIAGLCDVIVVVESKASGGSIITAKFANAYNRDVFAVPGRLKDLYSAGCNWLIKTHQAALLESAEDIAYVLRWDKLDAKRRQIQTQVFVDLNEGEKQIVDLLRQNEQAGIDTITYRANLPPSEVAALLLGLEMKGIVRMMPGKQYVMT